MFSRLFYLFYLHPREKGRKLATLVHLLLNGQDPIKQEQQCRGFQLPVFPLIQLARETRASEILSNFPKFLILVWKTLTLILLLKIATRIMLRDNAGPVFRSRYFNRLMMKLV